MTATTAGTLMRLARVRSALGRRMRWRGVHGLVALGGFFTPLWAMILVGPAPDPHEGVTHGIPVFARKYRTSCSTCHTAAPKLNVLGEAFRLNGYRFPENDRLLRRDEPVRLGAEPWKDLWPRSIWPGEISGIVPLALRIQNDAEFALEPNGDLRWTFRFPQEIYLLGASTLGDDISAFFEAEWSRERDVDVVQAKLEFQDLIPGLPERALNLWVGLQNLYLFTFTDRQIDRAARQKFRWQDYQPADLSLRNPGTGEELRSINTFRLGQTQPAVEFNGLLGGRLYYGLGLAQGVGDRTTDDNNRKDLFYKIRYKLGGLRLDGRYDPGGGPVLGRGGQLLDRSLTVEHFGYFGGQPVAGDQQDNHRSFGVSARLLYGPADVGVGYVWGSHDNPWGATAAGKTSHSDFFAKAEYLFFPWLIGSLKFDSFSVDVPASVRQGGFTEGRHDQTRILPGVIALVRQNVRVVLEAEIFTEHQASSELNQQSPQALWFRLDVAF